MVLKRLRAEDMTAAAGKIAEHITHVLVRGKHFDLVERLQEHRTALGRHGSEGEDAGHLEGHLVRVDRVIRAVKKLDLEVHERKSGKHTANGRLLDAAVDRRDVLP